MADRTAALLGDDDADGRRAASVTVSHVLTIAITTVLVSTLLVGSADLLADQRERAVREELNAVGQRVSLELSRTGTLAATGTDGSASLSVAHPPSVVDAGYTIRLTDDPEQCSAAPPPCLVLSTTDPAVTVTVPVRVGGPDGPALSATDSEVTGGRFRIVVGGGSVTLEGSA